VFIADQDPALRVSFPNTVAMLERCGNDPDVAMNLIRNTPVIDGCVGHRFQLFTADGA
jgi:hypothetical protein